MKAELSTPTSDRYFEDYVPGLVHECGPIEATEEEIISFALRFDPQTMHIDPAKAAEGAFHGLIASGLHTVALMMRLYVTHVLTAVASLASPGLDELRWPLPVRPGDHLTLRYTVLEANPSKSKPNRGTVISRLEGINQKGELVCSFKAVNLVGMRPKA